MNTYLRLGLEDREEISRGIWAEERFAVIARRLNRPTSTVSREVWNLVAYRWCYRAEKAQERANAVKAKGRPQETRNERAVAKIRLRQAPL